MTVVMITNLVLSIAMVKNANLDILIGKNSLSLSLALSLFLLMILWVLRCRNAYKYHQLFSSLSLPSDGFVGLAVLQCL